VFFIGWLGGEPDHCRMVAIPTLEEDDVERPGMKACLARLGIRNFKSTLRKAPERLKALRTPEGELLPLHTLAERRRDMARLRCIMDQVKEIDSARLFQLSQPGTFADPLTEVLRDGAQALLAQAIRPRFLPCSAAMSTS
jgi:transposase